MFIRSTNPVKIQVRFETKIPGKLSRLQIQRQLGMLSKVGSVAVSAELSLRSPGKLFICTIKKIHLQGQRSRIENFNFEKNFSAGGAGQVASRQIDKLRAELGCETHRLRVTALQRADSDLPLLIRTAADFAGNGGAAWLCACLAETRCESANKSVY